MSLNGGRLILGFVLLVAVGLLAGIAHSSWPAPEVLNAETEVARAPIDRVRVEVLNAGGVDGQARAAMGRLRSVGFDVVQWGNAGEFDRSSSVGIDRGGRLDMAGAVANALGIHNVLREADSSLFVDVTVLLGNEWSGVIVQEEDSLPAPSRTPWDLRGWFSR